MLGEEQTGRWGLERSFCQVLPTTGAIPLWDALAYCCIHEDGRTRWALLRGSVGCTDKTSSKLLRRQFRLLSCVKSGREGNHVGASIGFALGGSIISTNLKHTHQAIEDDLTRSSTKCTMTVGARETIGRVSPDTGLNQIAGRDGWLWRTGLPLDTLCNGYVPVFILPAVKFLIIVCPFANINASSIWERWNSTDFSRKQT